ncbi:hypothetical protein [Collinsella intestinalis]|uniref:Chromosome partition protein Smc n=1 Tax=Collinsella intestinalis TaxID=147207 RepID=A0A414NH42_9ACTN|nr:hypothetical protein [Collinsella intestinalis]RHF39077.1 hypothetical protein DW682_05265 [Collinsella intestinalis]
MNEEDQTRDFDGTHIDRPEDAPADEQAGKLPSFLEHHARKRADIESDAMDSVGTDTPSGCVPTGEPSQTAEESDRGDENAISNAAANIGSFFSDGIASVKAMSAARRAHAEAREELNKLENTIDDRERELEHRRDVAHRYADILEEQSSRKAAAEQAAREAETRREDMTARADELKRELKQMSDEDATTEKRLKTALDAAADKERSARESGRRLQNRLDDAKSDLERLEEERRASLLAAEQAISSAQAHLDALNAEYADLQRNPSANSAGYSVRSRELELEISDAAAALRDARENLPVIDRETQREIDEALRAIDDAQKPIPVAKASFEEVAAAADRAREAHAAAREDAEKRQKELRGRIADETKAAKEQDREREMKMNEAADAQALIDEAEDIHAHPEVTEAIHRALEADRAELEDRREEVNALAAEEHSIREKTRAPRLRFITVIAAALLVIALLLAWMLLT